MAGRTTVMDLLALVARARQVLSGDTGIAHMAVATGTASVTLFGPTSPSRWGPPRMPRHVALWAGDRGDPHADRPHHGLLRIGVADVLRHVR
jgi:ADP-heptose:LPS heptosyltransferase